MPISWHFQDCKALQVARLTHVRGAIASTRPLLPLLYSIQAVVVVYVTWPCKDALTGVCRCRGRCWCQTVTCVTCRCGVNTASRHTLTPSVHRYNSSVTGTHSTLPFTTTAGCVMTLSRSFTLLQSRAQTDAGPFGGLTPTPGR